MSEPSVFSPSSGNLKSTGLVPWWEKFLQATLSPHWLTDPYEIQSDIWIDIRSTFRSGIHYGVWSDIQLTSQFGIILSSMLTFASTSRIFSLSLLENLYSQDTSTGKGWCSTLTDKSAYHISGKGYWGECNLVTSAGITRLYFHIWNYLSLQWPARATRTVSTLIKQSLASRWKRTWRSASRWMKQMSAKPTSSAT